MTKVNKWEVTKVNNWEVTKVNKGEMRGVTKVNKWEMTKVNRGVRGVTEVRGSGVVRGAMGAAAKLHLHLKIWVGGKYFEAGKRKKGRQKFSADISKKFSKGGGNYKIRPGR